MHILGEHQTIESQAARAPGEADPAKERLAYDALLGGFAKRLDDRVAGLQRERSKARALRTFKRIVLMISLPLLAFGVRHGYVSWITNDLQTRADAALTDIPALKGYPVKAHAERGGHRLWITGLVPDDTTQQEILARMAQIAAGVELRDAVSVLPNPDVDGRLGAEALKRAVEGARRKLGVVASDLAAARTGSADPAEREALAAAETTTRAAIGDLEQGDPVAIGGTLDRNVVNGVGDLRSAAERLGALTGIEVQWPGPVPSGARDGADALSLAAERVSILVVALEQRRSVTPIVRQIDNVRDRMAERILELERRLEQLRPPPPTPREQLAAFVRDHAVFFGADAEYRDAAATARTLDTLVPLLTAGAAIRIVGYTDEAGNAARNSPLAQARADRVLADLVARGIDRGKLIAVGRANGLNLAPGAGVDSPNRRVEFEMAFDGEQGLRP